MSGEERMPDDIDPRMLRAMKKALIASAPPMPADLKAELMRLARARAPRPSWLDVLKESLTARPWAYGAGAAFAAAGALLVLRFAATPASGPAPLPVAQAAPAAPPPLADLWTDDDGGDEDEG